MAPDRPKSPKERRDARNARSFVGRIEQQDQFRRSLLQPDHSDARIIFSISGQGGVGKTTLLKEFRRITEEHGYLAAYVDEGVATNRVDDVPEAMHRLAEDLERQGLKFDKFREQYKSYRIKKQEMEAEPEAPKGLLGDTTRGLLKGALDLGKSQIPVVGGMIDSEMVAAKAGELVNYGLERFRNKDEERLMKETLEVLTPLFLEGIRRIPEEKTLVLMLDTYEITGAFLDAWIRALLDEEFGAIERALLLCIAGRQPIDRNAWIEWEPVIARSPLEPFTELETRQFLTSHGIRSEAVINEIWRLSSGGLPLLVTMMAQNAPTNVDAVVDYCDLAVERFLKWETDETKKQLAQDGALPRVLNEDVVAALEDGQFDWLKSCAFVLRDGERWRYHLVVREQMLRYQLQKSPKRWAEMHGKLAAYYEQVRSNLGLEAGKEGKDRLWRELSLEWLYHELCVAPQAKLVIALNGFLVALRTSRVFAREWATVIVQAGQEARCEILQKWGERLRNGMVAYQEKRYEETISALTALSISDVIEEQLKAVALNWRGCCYRWSKQEKLALKDFQQVVKMDGKDAKYWFDLALTYQDLEQYEGAILAYQQALELDLEYAAAHNNLGSVFKEQKRYEEAVSAYKQAISLDPKLANPHAGLGNLYKEQKRYEEAVSAYQQAINLDPKWATPHNNLGNLYKEQKRYEEAISAYQQAINLNPKWATPHNNLGNLYKEQKRYEEAISAYQQAINLDPEYKWAIANRGEVHRLMKRYEEALKDFNKAIELNSEYCWAIARRSQTYEALDHFEEAFNDLNRVLEIDPGNVLAHRDLGFLQYELGRYEASLSSFKKAFELQPDNSLFPSNLAYLYLLQNKLDKAEEMIEMAIRIKPFYRAWLNFGLVQAQQGKMEEAKQSWQQGISLIEENSDWDRPVRYVFTVALGNLTVGLEKMRKLIDLGFDKFALKNALNDTILLSRSQPPIEGIEKMLQLLQKALS